MVADSQVSRIPVTEKNVIFAVTLVKVPPVESLSHAPFEVDVFTSNVLERRNTFKVWRETGRKK
jgi:hypothetical protein